MKDKIDLQFESNLTNEFIQIFEERLIAIDEKILFANDELVKVNYEISKFYLEEDIYASKSEIRVTKKTADENMKRKLHRYSVIVGILYEKYKVLKEKLNAGYFTDKLELANAKLDLLNLQVEIINKEKFLAQLKTRSNVYNKN
jgi:hypothetical protein